MNRRLAIAFLGAVLGSAFPSFAKASGVEDQERLAVAHLLAFGRLPAADEIEMAPRSGGLTVAALLDQHRQRLQADAAAREITVRKAWVDTFGRPPTAAERATAEAVRDLTYAGLMQAHWPRLADDPDEYARILDRVYRTVVQRGVYPEEIDYWRQQTPLPFVVLAGCVENWARRNQPGLMVTTGTPTVSVNSDLLVTLRLSPTVAAEARAAAGLQAASEILPEGRLVAVGSGKIATTGHMHLAIAGGERLAAVP